MSKEKKTVEFNKETSDKVADHGIEMTDEDLHRVVGGGPIGAPGGPRDDDELQEWWKPVQLIDSCGNWELRPYTSGEGIAQSQGEPRKVCATCNHFGFCGDETYCTFKY